MDLLVALERLEDERYGRVICYPRYDLEEFRRRLEEMKRLGIRTVSFTGEKMVSDLPVLGKGCVGIVVLAYTGTGKVALKIRRTDADRSSMGHEAEMLRVANSVDVGPRLLEFTGNLLMMEFIDGMLLPKWIESLREKDAQSRIRIALRALLEQAWRLDEAGLDHGELSRAPKHIILNSGDKPYLLDFETASTARRVSNVTSICQYLFISGKTAELIGERYGKVDGESLLSALRRYKKERTKENFENILEACMIQD